MILVQTTRLRTLCVDQKQKIRLPSPRNSFVNLSAHVWSFMSSNLQRDNKLSIKQRKECPNLI